jgi:hypothetical protein
MAKKIMLVVVAVILLVGVENLIAQERRGRPDAEQEQKGQPVQLRRQRAGEEAGRGRMEGMQQRRQSPSSSVPAKFGLCKRGLVDS